VTKNTGLIQNISPENIKKISIIELEKELHLNLRKDLGLMGWTPQGVFILPDITIEQVRRVRRLVEAKNGWPHRDYSGSPWK